MLATTSTKYSQEIPAEIVQEMTQRALDVQENCYCPYSNFKVSCAVLTDSGKIFTGTNVENAVFAPSICAERVAIAKAVSEGYKDIKAVLITIDSEGTPCGVCRQMIHEFNPNAYIYCADLKGNVFYEGKLEELIPMAFGPKQLLS